MTGEIKITFLGDICPVNRVEKAIIANDYSGFEQLKSHLEESDLVVANLESPLTGSKRKIKKVGPNLKAVPESVGLLKYINIGLAAMANNHILDYGEEGLADTIQLLNDNKIDHVGAGINRKEADRPYLREIKGIKICLINICEREFNFTGDEHGRANLFDLITVQEQIREYRSLSDIIIIFYHGGFETYNLPTPGMYRNFRFLAGMGADVIICNHQHVFSGYEKINNSLIFYGLGNAIFDWPALKENPWNYGIILTLKIKNSKEFDFELTPYRQNGYKAGMEFSDDIREKVLSEIEKINSRLSWDSVMNEWTRYAKSERKNLLSEIFIQNRYFRYLLKKTGIINLLLTRFHILKLYNFFNCQSHSEIIRTSLSPYEGSEWNA